MAARFEVYTDKAGEYRWRLKMANGQKIASSGEGYHERRDCLDSIKFVQRDAPFARVVEP